MPELTRVLTEDDLARRGRTQRQDLTAYMSLIDQVREASGVGGVITLSEAEHQRTEKRRLTLAAKQRGYTLTWRRSDPGQLRFVLAEDRQPAPGGRARRTRAEQQMEGLAGEGGMTTEMDALVEPTANDEAAPAPAAAAQPSTARRRRKQA